MRATFIAAALCLCVAAGMKPAAAKEKYQASAEDRKLVEKVHNALLQDENSSYIQELRGKSDWVSWGAFIMAGTRGYVAVFRLMLDALGDGLDAFLARKGTGRRAGTKIISTYLLCTRGSAGAIRTVAAELRKQGKKLGPHVNLEDINTAIINKCAQEIDAVLGELESEGTNASIAGAVRPPAMQEALKGSGADVCRLIIDRLKQEGADTRKYVERDWLNMKLIPACRDVILDALGEKSTPSTSNPALPSSSASAPKKPRLA